MTDNTARTIIGKVVSNVRDKTIAVLVERQIKHKMYKKYIKRHNKLHAHDEKNECQVGDVVCVREVRPISKTKHWSLVEVLEKAHAID